MTFNETVAFYLNRIREAVPFKVKMMLVMWSPTDPDTVLIMGDDDPEAAMAAVKRAIADPNLEVARDIMAPNPS